MKKIYLTIMAMITLLLVGCGGGSKTQETSEGGKEKVNFVSWPSDNNEWEDIIVAFNKKYPDIEVEHTIYPHQEYETKLKILLTGGGEIDVFAGKNYETFVDLAFKDQLMPLDEKIKDARIKTNYYGSFYNGVKINGNVYGLPYKTTREILYFNKDMFDEKGLPYPEEIDYKEFRRMANELSGGSGVDRKYGAMLYTWPSRSQWYGLQSGDTIIDEDLSNFAKGMQMRIDMEDEGSMYKYNDLVSTGTHYSAAFAKGNIGMLMIGDWAIGMFKKAESEGKLDFNWGITKLPQDIEGANNSLGGFHPILISKSSKNKDASWKFAEFIATEEGQKIIAGNNVMPGFMNDKVKEVYTKVNAMEGLDEVLEANVYMEKPALPGMSIVEKIYKEELGLIYAREQNVETGFARIKDRIKSEVN